MSIKKIIAREYLYILGFIAGGALLGVLNYLLLQPSYPEWPRLYTWDEVGRIEPWETLTKMQEMRDYLTEAENDSILALLGEYDSTASEYALVNYLKAVYAAVYDCASARMDRDWEDYRGRLELLEFTERAVLFVPYPLFLIIRSIMWAVRQVRKK